MSGIATSSPRRLGYSPLSAVYVALGAAAVCALVGVYSGSHLGLYAVVGALFLACFLPLWLAWSTGRLDYFEIVHVVGLLTFLQFGAGSLWVVHNPQYAYDYHLIPYILPAASYALIGWICFLIGYYGLWTKFPAASPSHVTRPRGGLLLVATGGAGLLGYLTWAEVIRADALDIRSALTGVTSVLGQLSPLFMFAWALGWLLVWSRTANRAQKAALFCVLVPGALLIVRSYLSDKSVAMSLVLAPLVAAWYTRRRLPKMAIIALLLAMIFVVFPLFNTYRLTSVTDSPEQRLDATMLVIKRWDSSKYLEASVGDFFTRMALVNSLAVVVRDVGRWVEPFPTERLVMAPLIVLVPRFIWPDKPRLELGREFGYVFRVTGSYDDETSIAPSVPGEFYWYLGLPGIMIGMFLIGALYRLIYRRLIEESGGSPVRVATYVMLWGPLVTLEGGVVSFASGLVKLMVLLGLLLFFARKLGAVETVPRSAGVEA